MLPVGSLIHVLIYIYVYIIYITVCYCVPNYERGSDTGLTNSTSARHLVVSQHTTGITRTVLLDCASAMRCSCNAHADVRRTGVPAVTYLTLTSGDSGD